MKSETLSCRWFLPAGVACLLILPSGTSWAEVPGLHDWTLQHSIGMRMFSWNLDNTGDWPSSRSDWGAKETYVRRAPNGKAFFVVSHRGLLDEDANVYRLSVYSTDSIRRALRTNRETQISELAAAELRSTSSSFAGIDHCVWQGDSRSLTFQGMAQNGYMQLFKLDIYSNVLKKLTDVTAPIYSADFRSGGFVVTTSLPSDRLMRNSYPVTFPYRVSGKLSKTPEKGQFNMEAIVSREDGVPTKMQGVFAGTWISPDGNFAILRKGLPGARQFALVSLQTGKWNTIVDFANGGRREATSAAWSVNGQFVRLLYPNGGARSAFEDQVYQLSTGSWVSPGTSLVRFEEPSIERTLADGITISVTQSANSLPRLVADNGKRQVQVIPDQDSLRGVSIAQFEDFRWRDPDGVTVTGQLLLPMSEKAAAKLPLIVEVVGFVDSSLFLPDGAVSTAYASQAYAARGFAVLRVPFARPESGGAAVEGPRIVARIDAAIKALSQEVDIDKSRIGAIGHSRTGFQVLYAVTHPRETKLGAAAVMDSFINSYSSYLESSAWNSGFTADDRDYAAMPGGPFWKNKSAWLEHEVTFNLDRVKTPTIFALHGRGPADENQGQISGIDDVVGAFNFTGRPIESMWLPHAEHTLVRPRERLAEMGTVMDWMLFWLLDISPSDRALAARWEPLRSMQAAVLAEPASPRVKWVSIPSEGRLEYNERSIGVQEQ